MKTASTKDQAIRQLELIMGKQHGTKTDTAEEILNFIEGQEEGFIHGLYIHMIMFFGLVKESGIGLTSSSVGKEAWNRLTIDLESDMLAFKRYVSSSNDEPEMVATKLRHRLSPMKRQERIVFLAHILMDADSFVPYRKIPAGARMPQREFEQRLEKSDSAIRELGAILNAISKGRISEKTVSGFMILDVLDSLPDRKDKAIVLGNIIDLNGGNGGPIGAAVINLGDLLGMAGPKGGKGDKAGLGGLMSLLGDVLGRKGLKPGEGHKHNCAECEGLDECPLPPAEEYRKAHPGGRSSKTGLFAEDGSAVSMEEIDRLAGKT